MNQVLSFSNTRNFSLRNQYLIATGIVLLVSIICFFGADLIGYRIVALILLVTVSVLAMLFDIFPVLSAALLSALIWNFFFIPPLYTFHIHSTEDMLMFFLYFFIASVNAVLTLKIRREEKRARDKEEKENLIKLYNTLLNSLSHELKTPVSTIIGAVDTLKENANTLSESNQQELLNQIELASTRLNWQVENLLSMSRLESGMLKLKRDWCDINELVYSVIHKLTINHKQQLVFYSDESLPWFKLDSVLIEQAIHNLLHNAILYTPETSCIEIKVSYQFEKCIIRVSDNGNGISDEELFSIFDKFYRLPNSGTGGTGLGLSIVKGFVEAHKGTVRAEKNEPKGVSFVIEIPAEISHVNSL